MAAMSEPVIIDLNGCARCRGDGHEGLFFYELTYPVENENEEVIATHWARCPTTGEPILMIQREVKD